MALSRLQIESVSNRYPELSINPTIIGCYSIDEEGFTSTAENVKYLRLDHKSWLMKNNNFNLNGGRNSYIRKSANQDGTDNKIDYILRWILDNQFLRTIRDGGLYVICLRGLLKTVMKTPFLRDDSWYVDAVKVRNIIFLCVFRTEEDVRRNQIYRRTEYYGQKFEQCMLTVDPDLEPNLQAPVNANTNFCLVFRAELNGHNLIYGGETDALKSDSKLTDEEIMELEPSSFVELKTTNIFNSKSRRFKEINLLNCWAQAYLTGIEDILWGFQNGNGKLRQWKWDKTSKLPEQAQNMWSPHRCKEFLGEFLNFVKTTMQDEPDWTYYRFSRNTTNPRDANFVVATKMMPCPEENKIIPEWFEQEIRLFLNRVE